MLNIEETMKAYKEADAVAAAAQDRLLDTANAFVAKLQEILTVYKETFLPLKKVAEEVKLGVLNLRHAPGEFVSGFTMIEVVVEGAFLRVYTQYQCDFDDSGYVHIPLRYISDNYAELIHADAAVIADQIAQARHAQTSAEDKLREEKEREQFQRLSAKYAEAVQWTGIGPII